ncbi:MAG: hypothetical protein H6R15_3853 [Proteobacteria bacterium]|nr:hypothetical protein [Pseudomonadota bacterium]
MGFAVMCQLASAPSAFYAISPPRGATEVSVASHVCTPASRPFAELMAFRRVKAKQFAFTNPAFTLQTSPHKLALAFG